MTRPTARGGRPASPLRCVIALPEDFRAGDLLAFHRRDVQAVAERVVDDRLAKGLVWHGQPACLTIAFAGGQVRGTLAIDGAPATTGTAAVVAVERLVRHMLGLDQPVAAFARQFATHPQLGPLIARHPGLRVPQAATPFEALTWAVTGQQISVQAAVSLRRRLIQAAAIRHADGLFCYPDAGRLAALSEGELRAAGLSASKARTLRELGALVANGQLPLDHWLETQAVEAIRDGLLAVRGIGPWTINYALLRGFGWLDGSLHGDVAVRRGLQSLLGRADKIGESEARDWLAGFSPWRALVAAHLWRL